MRVAIYGAGQHGAVVWDCLTAAGHAAVAFIDDLRAGELYGAPVVRRLDDAPAFDGVIVAIGDNAVRKRISMMLRDRGHPLVNAIHPTATISRQARLGHGVAVMAGAIISVEVSIGDGAIIDVRSAVGHHSNVDPWTHLAASFVGSRVAVGEGAFVGIGAHVVPDIHVGAWSRVLAGALVTRDVAAGSVVLGVPARPHLMPRLASTEKSIGNPTSFLADSVRNGEAASTEEQLGYGLRSSSASTEEQLGFG